MSLEQALNTIKAKRPEIKPSPSYYLQLQEYEQHVNKTKKFKKSRLGYFFEKLFGYLDIGNFHHFEEGNNFIEKVSHNWVQLTFYLFLMIFIFRFGIQLMMLILIEEKDTDEENRLPCS